MVQSMQNFGLTINMMGLLLSFFLNSPYTYNKILSEKEAIFFHQGQFSIMEVRVPDSSETRSEIKEDVSIMSSRHDSSEPLKDASSMEEEVSSLLCLSSTRKTQVNCGFNSMSKPGFGATLYQVSFLWV